MAFAKGAFQGYNEAKDMERKHLYDLELQKAVNDGKDTVEADPMFTVFGEGNVPYNFFTLPDASAGTESERAEKWMDAFYTDTRLKNKKYMDALKETDPEAYNQIMAAHDGQAKRWLMLNRKQPEKGGVYHYLTGDAYLRNRGHWLEDRFDQIALGNIPLVDDNQLLISYEDATGNKFAEAVDYDPDKYGYGTLDEYRRKVAEISQKKGGFYNTKLHHFTQHYNHQDWNAYSRLEPIMDKLLNNTFDLSRAENEEVANVFADYGYGKEKFMIKTAYGQDRWNVQKVHRFFTLAAQPVHREFNGIDGYYTINDRQTYLKRVLGFDKGIDGLRSKARSVNEAIQTIRQVRSLIDLEEGQEGIALFGIPAGLEKIKYAVFGEQGFIDQMMNVISNSGAQFGNDDGTVGTRENMVNKLKQRLKDNAGASGIITRREVLMELLAYQLAAAIQGGTGGRTISDQDVLNIKRALGATVFTSAELQRGRLDQLEGMMLDLREVTSTYTRSNTIEELKAADLTTKFLLDGRDLKSMNNSYAIEFVQETSMIPEDGAVIEEKNRMSEFTGARIDDLDGIFNSLADARNSPEGQKWIENNRGKDFDETFKVHFLSAPKVNEGNNDGS